MILARYADRPDLRERRDDLDAFPEPMFHNRMGPLYWARLYDEHPAFQLAVLDGDELVAELHSVPLAWSGGLDDLPAGWDDAFVRAFESGRTPDALCALAIAVRPDRRGQGLSGVALNAMADAGRDAGLRELIAPVRPTLKERYPLIPIERYMGWRRDDGAHFDPWIRLHERVGGEIIAAAPESMEIVAPVAEWEAWTGIPFPDDGDYVVPGMLAPVSVRDGVGRHVEPNVWLRHRL